ncbi:SDR family oxidoreductase [Curtobacterium pusillum]|uniref:SDR family NAD(P)-dependent oxidoreductase n=1 Tax=Curtobacterium pusillum TaxID=69373 RepID=UPI00119F0E89|nr:SDR family oxidoreductase [Curtobacterium pusillum]
MTALITGASSGIGLAFAEQLAAERNDLVLVARRRDRLEAAAARLQDRHGVLVTVVPADLTEDGIWDRISDELDAQGITVDTLVNNAGFGVHDDVANSNPVDLAREVQVNCTALVGLTTRLLPGMVARGSGSIINIGSTASFQPVPHMAAYGASKAFVLSFTEALAVELQGTGVRALALCPGATDTEFFDVAGESARTGRSRSAADLVRHGLRALRAGRSSTVHGLDNALVANIAARLLPRRTIAGIAGRATGLPQGKNA